jgi:hypothetical protein
LDDLHKKVGVKAKAARGRKKKAFGVRAANFALGDYVLMSSQLDAGRPKLQVVWKGPCRVVRVVSDWVFEVENLVTNQVSAAHASRLRFYVDSALGNVEEVKRQASHSEVHHEAKSLEELRYNDSLVRWEILVHWLGLELAEASWNLVAILREDVPAIFHKFVVKTLKNPKLRDVCRRMCRALEFDTTFFEGGSDASAAT